MLGYFGPAGTFTHQALLSITDAEAVPFATVGHALDAVRTDQVEAALVPIENSVEGGVTATLDNLASDRDPLVIRREVLLPVQFVLAARPGTALADVRRVLTHPHAYAQTRDWLGHHLPEAHVTEGGSTAGAAEEVADPNSRFDAAVCARVASDLYGLTNIATDIADNRQAVTRFVLAARPGRLPEPTGADKTTLVAYMHTDQPGALLEILDQFAVRGVNLTRIESRPTKTNLGDYCFSIDAEGHVEEPRMAETLMGLHRVCQKVTFLGSYPRADKKAPMIARGFSAEEFVDAREWFAGVVGR
ncbi:prephenate dehydratase [Nigerium massiliense]|uniref:prephenate dehydratase n=1 Tax=Nigerium massiliense TaxID=1522317 RepID=UPI0005901CBA|nr:prephenate dehydratase [Nigerium massiliense]